LAKDLEKKHYEKLSKDNKDGEWLLKMLKQGTASDKI